MQDEAPARARRKRSLRYKLPLLVAYGIFHVLVKALLEKLGTGKLGYNAPPPLPPVGA